MKNLPPEKAYALFPGLTPTRSYHPGNALALGIACRLTYEKNISTLKRIIPDWGFQFDELISVKKGGDIDTQCYIMHDADNILVVFRGSDSRNDWLGNFQAVYDPGPLHNTKAHEGFQDALYPAVISLTRLIHTVCTDPAQPRIWITGHSLGGALASLYAGMLCEHYCPVYGLYTYGSPRPGNGAFAEQLNACIRGPHHRVVNSGDLVPHVPPEPFYSHPGNRMILRDKSTTRTKKSWFAQRTAALKRFVAMTFRTFDFGDNHGLDGDGKSYLPRLLNHYRRWKKSKTSN